MLTDNEMNGLIVCRRRSQWWPKQAVSRFCYCYCQERGRTDKTKLAGRDDNTVRYCQVRNIIAANWRGWPVGCGRRGWPVQGRGRALRLYAFVVPNKWTDEWPNNNRITGQRGTDSMSAVENGLSWPHWSMGKPATRSGRIASCSRCETTDALMLGLPGGREGKESGAEKRRMEGMMLNEGGERGYDSSTSYCKYYCAQQQDGRASH